MVATNGSEQSVPPPKKVESVKLEVLEQATLSYGLSNFTLRLSHFGDLLRNLVIRVQVRSKVFVRELLRTPNLQLVRDLINQMANVMRIH
jgi:hypothetical protein